MRNAKWKKQRKTGKKQQKSSIELSESYRIVKKKMISKLQFNIWFTKKKSNE